MKEPLFKPGQWVSYQRSEDGEGGFGEITAGYFDGSDWQYVVHNGTVAFTDAPDGTPVDALVLAEDIKFIYEGDNWMAPSTTLGSNSVYVHVSE